MACLNKEWVTISSICDEYPVDAEKSLTKLCCGQTDTQGLNGIPLHL